jgi:predicted secreted protein
MIRALRVALVLLVAALLLSACSGGSWTAGWGWGYMFGAYSPRIVSTEDSGEEVSLSHGQQLFVRLPYKGEAGYEWTLREPITAAVKPEGAPQQDKDAGTEVWTFTPVRDGQQTLRLEYRRADDYFTVPAESVSYNVTVE